MKNSIYDLINDGDFNVEMYEDTKLNDIENRKMKNNFKKSQIKHKGKYKKIAAGFIVSLAIGGIFLSTEIGATAITAVTKSIEKYLNINKKIDDYKIVVNDTACDNGFTIKLNEVVIDNTQLIISKNITSDKGFNDKDFCNANEKVYINGKEMEFGTGSGESSKIDEYTIQSISEHDLSEIEDMDLSKDLDVKISYNNILVVSGDTPKNVHGNWTFDIKVSKDAVKKAIEAINKIKINYEFVLPNGEKIVLEEYKSSDMDKKIYARKENFTEIEEYDIALLGTDDFGNRVDFSCSDDRDGKYIFGYCNQVSKIDENATKLILKPYAEKLEGLEDGYDMEAVGEEFEIDLTKLK